jgi:uncharacterized protein YndB with AHSA1/START domain
MKMATTQATPQLNLEVRRTFAASRERVFAAWTQRDQYCQWMGRATPPRSTVEHLEFDPRPGGRFAISNTSPTGVTKQVHGEFREITPPKKIVFTWQPSNLEAGTLVTVEFFERGDKTELVLTHIGFLTAEDRDGHNNGWNACFDSLAAILKLGCSSNSPNRCGGRIFTWSLRRLFPFVPKPIHNSSF